MDLINDIQKLMEELTISIKKLSHTGQALAEAERDYKITLRQEALKLRSDGMAVTVMLLLIRFNFKNFIGFICFVFLVKDVTLLMLQ